MKKSYNPITDVRSEGVDVTRRLYRAISDVVRHLDDSRGRAEVCSDLFTATLEAQRMKLRDYCERLIFSDPVGYGRKGEELLWRKGYYDVVTTAKHFRKEQTWSDAEVCHLKSHLLAGVGHYHHLLFRLQTEFRLDFEGLVDFPLFVNNDGLAKGKSMSQKKSLDSLYVEWGRQAAQRCLVYLGDLSRYLLDLDESWDSGMAQRYYMQALNMKCEIGMPHNQLGTMSGSKTWSLDAAYHYMRCLMCQQSFEGAEGNLMRLLEKNDQWLQQQQQKHQWDENKPLPQVDHVHQLVAQFLHLQDVWFFCKAPTTDLQQVCHQAMRDLQQCLSYVKLSQCDSDLKDEEGELLKHMVLCSGSQDLAPDHICEGMFFKMVIMMLMCISKLQAAGSQQVSVAIAFLTAIFNYLVEKVISNIQESVFVLPPSPTPPVTTCPGVKGAAFEKATQNGTVFEDAMQKRPVLDAASQNGDGFEVAMQNGMVFDDAMQKRPVLDAASQNGDVCEVAMQNGNSGADELQSKSPDSKVAAVCSDQKDKFVLKTKGKIRGSRRRRRRRRLDSSEDSDLSEGEVPYGESSSSDEDNGNSDISEGVELIEEDTSSEEEDEEDTDESLHTGQSARTEMAGDGTPTVVVVVEASNGVHEKGDEIMNGTEQNVVQVNGSGGVAEESATGSGEPKETPCQPVAHRLDVADLVGVLLEEGFLQSLKVCSDWLRGDSDVVRACSQTLRSLMSRVVCLLNMITIDPEFLDKVIDESCVESLMASFHKIPLPEDVELRGLAILKTSHEDLDWEYPRHHKLSNKEEAVVRALKLAQFGHYLASVPEAGVSYNAKTKTFVISHEPVVPRCIAEEEGKDVLESSQAGGGDDRASAGTEVLTPRGQLMHHMGQLWLRAEVRDLESRVRKRGAAFSPYLAVDCDALTYHIHLVKQLVAARRFILLIPNAVVSALDKLKREVGRARETIRWLEMQFQRGNRFLRAQRVHEQTPLPLIKYPKKKDREAWLFFQIVECCYYFSKQTGVHETHPETSLVTLLTGQRSDQAVNRGFSPTGVAKSAGINLEHIETFHAKWKASSKSHG